MVARLSFVTALLLALSVACESGSSDPISITSTRGVVATPSGVAERLTPSPVTRTPAPAPTPPAGLPLAIINGTLVDGTGAAPLPDAVILVREGLFERVGHGSSPGGVPEGYQVIDAGGGFILPGLVDGHVHLTGTVVYTDAGAGMRVDETLSPFRDAGFTTLRDVGAPPDNLGAIRSLVDSMTARGLAPTVVWAGPLITAPGGYPISVPRYASVGQEIESPEEGEALVDRLANDGARLIKLGLDKGYYADEGWPLLSLEAVQAITRRAHERGLLVTAHVTSLDEVRLAIDGGADNLAHTPVEALPSELIAEMVAKGMGIVTTVTVLGGDVAADNAVRFCRGRRDCVHRD